MTKFRLFKFARILLIQDANYQLMAAYDFKDTDQCVMCGLCLPHCPTYAITRDEGDSPRGRIALIQALAQERIDTGNERLAIHLDRCLGCRACEAMCPSKVPFMKLMDAARGALYEHHGKSRYDRYPSMLLDMAGSKTRTRLASGMASLASGMGLKGLAGDSGLGQLLGLVPDKTGAEYPHITEQADASPVFLFSGCMGELADQETIHAAKLVLGALGFRVLDGLEGSCCGAIHRHAGRVERADELRAQNLKLFSEHPEAPVLSIASGCAGELADYPDEVKLRHVEISSFLQQQMAVDRLNLKSSDARVALHRPCTHRNVIGNDEHVAELLDAIPGVESEDLPLAYGCCGAGGLNLLTQPEVGATLLDPTIEWLRSNKPDLVVSTNIGCSLHIARSAKEAGMATEVVHPVTLLARQLKQQ
jgi:glycolate oxidase iron-sulfur subunit